MSDPIQPPAARQPEEALELASQALSDGDLEAALAQYEPQARLVTWRRPQTSADGAVRNALTCFMALRLPLAVQIATVLRAPGLALVICARHTAGTGPDGEEIKYRGNGCAVVRAQPDGTWRIAADAWHLGAEDLDADHQDTEVPPGADVNDAGELVGFYVDGAGNTDGMIATPRG